MAVSRELEERSAALNKELKLKESKLTGQLERVAKKDEELETEVRVRSDLSAVYIGAIRSKLELLEEINSLNATPANTA